MRNVWWLAVGLMASAAACGGSDDDADDELPSGADGGVSSTSSGASGSSSGAGSSSGGASSGQSSSGELDAAAPDGSVHDGDAGDADASDGEAGDGDAGEADASDASDASVPPVFEYTKFDLNHLLVAGQSNALGIGGGVVLDTTPRGAACSSAALEQCSGVMFGSGVFPSTNCVHDNNGCSSYEARTSFLPLVEGDRYDNAGSYALQTPSSAMANQAAELAASVYFPGTTLGASGVRMLVSNHARSGNSYECIRKGSCPRYYAGNVVPASVKKAFEDGLDQVHQAKLLAASKAWSYAVRGVFLVHGESNHNVEANYHADEFPMRGTDGTPNKVHNYKEALLEWQHDYETDITAETGQSVPVPLYLTQMTNWTWSAYSPAQTAVRSLIPGFQLDAFRANPSKIILVTPTYPFPFNNIDDAQNGYYDKVHLTPTGSRRVGEYFAKAYAQTTFTGVPWKPLHPIAVTRAGAVITVQYYVPALPLAFDTDAVSDPNGHRGFRYVDGSATPATILTQVIEGDKVVITLSKVPDGANKRIQYAYDGVPGNAGGPTTGPRGNLRDSDATVSVTGGAPLVNWSVAYDEAVP